jgi:hypothetical protein
MKRTKFSPSEKRFRDIELNLENVRSQFARQGKTGSLKNDFKKVSGHLMDAIPVKI